MNEYFVHANAWNMRVKVIEKLEQNPIGKKIDTDFFFFRSL